MTIAINQEPRFQKTMLVVGAVVAALGLALGIPRIVGSDVEGNDSAAVPQTMTGLGRHFVAAQDGYLVPTAILSKQAQAEAELRLQDGYLPVEGAGLGAFLIIQDGYLPPSGRAPSADPAQPQTTARFGPR